MKHTPTPWTYSNYRNDDGTVSYFLQSSDEKQAIAELYVQPEAKGNADLIISCVNACEGTENPEAIKKLIEAANFVEKEQPWNGIKTTSAGEALRAAMEQLKETLTNLKTTP